MEEEHFRGQIYEKAVPLKLDLLDKKILYLLCRNARYANTTIAKALKISREVVAYRIKKMEASGFLHGFLTHVDSRKLGFTEFVLYLKLKTVTPEKELIQDLLTQKELVSLKTCSGKYDLQVILGTRSLEELDGLIKNIMNKYHTLVQDYVILTVVDMGFLGIRLLLDDILVEDLDKVRETRGSSFTREFERGATNNNTIVTLDMIDKKLLKVLELDARISLTELAKKTSTNVIGVKKRLKGLIADGVIKSFVPYFAMANIGYQWYKVFLRFQNLNERKFREYILRHRYMLWYMKFIGPWDYQVSVFARNHAHFHEIINNLREEFAGNIIAYDSVIVFNQFLFKPRVE